MRVAKILALTASLSVVLAVAAGAAVLLSEHVTGGQLDQHWVGGFDTPNNVMYGKTLDASDPAYANPSGDHTVAVAQNASPDSGGIIVTSVDPGAVGGDYVWEGAIFTGAGETRRGLILRANPNNDFKTFYMMVIEPGLFQMRFRKLVNGNPTTLQAWFANVLPAGQIPQNTWHRLKVQAQGSAFRVWFDDFELTGAGGPIVDTEIASGWVGVYNFRFDLGNVPVYFDDLALSCVSTSTVAFDFAPGTLNLRSAGRWIQAAITPAAPLTPADIDVSSLRLNGTVAVDPAAPVSIEDGTLYVKFARSQVALALNEGDAVTVSLSGVAAGGCIEGSDVVRVISPKVGHPVAGQLAAPGAPLTIDWSRTNAIAPTVAILASTDGGANWDIVARDIPNTGTYDWTVPNWVTSSARVAVVEVESTDPADPLTVNGTLGVSDAFTITGVLAVPGASADFALRPIGNPSAGALRVAFSLPSNAAAKFDVFDVTGRSVATRDVADGAGAHTLRVAEWVPAGVYVVRLSQAGRSLSTRITVVK